MTHRSRTTPNLYSTPLTVITVLAAPFIAETLILDMSLFQAMLAGRPVAGSQE